MTSQNIPSRTLPIALGMLPLDMTGRVDGPFVNQP
jgi:hypothetical protein